MTEPINGRIRELLRKPCRSSDEEDEMLYAAHACTYHWKFAGAAVNQQRSEWLISRVHGVLDQPQKALRHTGRCFQLTEAYKDRLADFDIAKAWRTNFSKSRKFKGFPKTGVRAYARTPVFGLTLFIL